MNYLKLDLTNRIVLVRKEFLKEEIIDRRFLCEGGFGCNPFTHGEKIFGRWLSDGEKDQIGGRWVESLFDEKEKATSPEVA